MSRRIDRAFDRFCRHGDPAALGQVFDLTAGELFRLAWHLCGDRHTAEDLVQTTFLVAIEEAGTRPAGAVLPWLCGILTNRARMRWRRQKVERHAATMLPATEAAPGDPVESVALRELSAAARQRLRALPEPYRTVCVLHLEQGLAPQDVARATGRADATVRSQLQRGLDMLRRGLPLALGLAPRAAMPVPDLADMRQRVLHRVPTGRLSAGGAGAAAWLVAGVATLLLLAVGAAWSWSSDRLPSVGEGFVDGVSASVDGTAHLVGGIVAPTTRRELAPAEPTAEPGAELLVRVRFARDGAPAEGVVVRCVPVRADGDLYERQACTDGRGVARFLTPMPGLVQVFADRGGMVETEVRRGGVSVITLVVPAGVLVRGQVTDLDDQPVGGASVWLSSLERDPRAGVVVATTGFDGSFALRDVSPGHLLAVWSEVAPATQVLMVSPNEQGEFTRAWLLGASAAGCLRGVVCDERGVPIANAKLQLGESAGPWTFGEPPTTGPGRNTSTDERGVFVFTGVGSDPQSVVSLRVCAPGRALVHVPVVIDGPTAVRVVLPPEARLVGLARGADGKAAWRGEVQIALAELLRSRPSLPRWAQLSASPGRDGRYSIGNVPAGHFAVRAADGVDIANAEFDFRAGEEHRWDAVLRERLICGEVVDESGRPLAGVPVRAANHTCPDVAPVSTDRAGRFRVDGLDAAAYELIVGLDPIDGVVRIAGVLPSTMPVRVMLPASYLPNARIALRIDGVGDESDAVVHLRRVRQDGSVDVQRVQRTDDRFVSPSLRAGLYRLAVSARGLGRRELDPVALAPHQALELPSVRFVAPGALAIELDGFEAEGRSVYVSLARSGEGDRDAVDLTARQGTHDGLQPGTYWVVADGAVLAAAAVQVESGRTTTVRLSLPHERLVRVRFPADAPPTTSWAWFDARGRLAGYWRLSDWQQPGETETESFAMRVAPGSYAVEVLDATGLLARAMVDVTEQTHELRLPAPPRKR